MAKAILLGITITAVIVAGLFAFAPVQEASSARSTPLERDNTTVTHITLENSEKLILFDNAGSGGLSDAEVTWRFDPLKCQVEKLLVGSDPSVAVNWIGMLDDFTFLPFAAHRDTGLVEAIALAVNLANENTDCTLSPDQGEFVTVSTVSSSV